MITAAALIVLFADPRAGCGWVYLGVLVALIVAQFVHTHIVIKPDDYDHLEPGQQGLRRRLHGVWIVRDGAASAVPGRARRGRAGR